jgi:hypothetical protein
MEKPRAVGHEDEPQKIISIRTNKAVLIKGHDIVSMPIISLVMKGYQAISTIVVFEFGKGVYQSRIVDKTVNIKKPSLLKLCLLSGENLSND